MEDRAVGTAQGEQFFRQAVRETFGPAITVASARDTGTDSTEADVIDALISVLHLDAEQKLARTKRCTFLNASIQRCETATPHELVVQNGKLVRSQAFQP